MKYLMSFDIGDIPVPISKEIDIRVKQLYELTTLYKIPFNNFFVQRQIKKLNKKFIQLANLN